MESCREDLNFKTRGEESVHLSFTWFNIVGEIILQFQGEYYD